ncbi:MAG: PAS domain-containing protein [Acidobacteriaceae bacterium]|nr:PAS domain-containing protein [Acidobacteriaceae bacterium]
MERFESGREGRQELYGWTAEEAVGAVSHNLLNTEFPASLEQIDETLRQEGSWQGELKHRSKDGHEIFVASHWVLHSGDGNEPLTVLEVNERYHPLESGRKRATRKRGALPQSV